MRRTRPALRYPQAGHSRFMCSKLWAIVNILRLGLTVLYCDSDVVVLRDPLQHWPPYDITFSWGGMGDPKHTTNATQLQFGTLPCFADEFQAGPCKICAGWMLAYPRAQVGHGRAGGGGGGGVCGGARARGGTSGGRGAGPTRPPLSVIR